jgi:hypothetical protein
VLLGVLLVLTIVALVGLRVWRATQQNQPAATKRNSGGGFSFGQSGFFGSSGFGGGGGYDSSPSNSASSDDMPDLDMLLGGAPSPAATGSAPPEPAFLRQPGIVNIRMSSDGRVVEAAEMLIIARDRVSDNLIVQIGENAYDGTEGGVDGEFRRRFVKIMRELSDIAPELSKSSSKPKQNAPPARPAPQPAPEPRAPETRAPAPHTDTSPDDLAGQIDMFLQRKLQTEPELAARGIRIHSAAGGGVRIEVDGQFYESVGDVEDEAVRQYIQQTIAEWQASNSQA